MTVKALLPTPFLALLLAACSSAPGTDDRPERPADKTDEVGETSSESAFSIVRRDDRISGERVRPLAHLEGAFRHALRPGESGLVATQRFVREHGPSYGLAASLSLSLVRERTDALGMRHVRTQQMVRGVPVLGKELLAHYDREGTLRSIDANLAVFTKEDFDTTATLSVEQAKGLAMQHYRANDDAGGLRAGRPIERVTAEDALLVIDPTHERLAYHLVVRATDESHAARIDYTVDALTGDVLDSFDNLQTVQASSKGAFGDMRNFEVTQSGNQFQMIDLSRTPNGIKTYSANGSQSRPGTMLTAAQPNAVWDAQAPKAPGAAVDAHFFAGFVYDFYKTKLARNGINGSDAAIISTAHFGQNYANAFWDGNQMTYGDGDDVNLKSLAGGLDVIAHELTHGVTQFESNLTYRNQSGAINEAMSDIMAAFVEASFQPDAKKNWLVGEVIGVKGPLRDMAHPGMVSQKQPTHMQEFITTSQDNGGVHINSGIVNNAAYLMTVGGTNDRSKVVVERGIGLEKATKLWYRMNEQYLMASSDFKAAADASAQAAKDLAFTADEISIVDCAWKAVGVVTGSCNTLAPQSSSSSSSGGAGGSPPAGGGGASGGIDPGAPGGGGDNGGGGPDGFGLDEPGSYLAEDNIVTGCSMAQGPKNGTGSVGAALAVAFGLGLAWRSRRRQARKDG